MTTSQEAAVYMAGTITWQANATDTEATANFHLSADQERGGFGSKGRSTSVTLDGGSENQSGAPNGAFIVDTTPGATTSYTFVMKMDQTNTTNPGAGNHWSTANPNMWLWINPDLGATEASQSADMSAWWSGQNSFAKVFCNHGTGTPNGDVVYSDFAVHYAEDTPFAIPEPTTALLGGLGALLLRRRRN